MRLLVINGPDTDAVDGGQLTRWGEKLGVTVEARQSEEAAEIIEWVHLHTGDGIVIDPGGLGDTAPAVVDAIRGVEAPVVEVHPGMVRTSVIRDVSDRMIYGRGSSVYRDAMRHLVNRAAMTFDTVAYGPHPDNVGDLRGEGEELVVLVHGGLWRREYERDTTESLAVDLARRGYRTWNVEYRRLGDGGGWPGSGQDVLTALNTIPQLVGRPDSVSVVGHSAGSYLLMWAGGSTGIEIGLHVAMAPLLDLEAAVESGDVGAEECAKLLKRGAPQVSPDEVPTVLVHGDADQIVPVQRSLDFSKRHGLDHHLTSSDHFSLLDPTRTEWEWVVDRLASR